MGHISNEPSMEEILSSIKRIIAEDGAKPRARKADAEPATAASVDGQSEPEVLELTDMVAGEEPQVAEAGFEPEPEPASDFQPSYDALEQAPDAEVPPAELVSSDAASASREALASLSRLLVKPEPESDGTLEGLVREMLRPMLKQWLDTNLPDLVESMVAKEIARITGKAL